MRKRLFESAIAFIISQAIRNTQSVVETIMANSLDLEKNDVES